MSRLPEYYEGRYFFSPILGCAARCHYCYIYGCGLTTNVELNERPASGCVGYLTESKAFVSGVHGSILAIGAWGDPFPSHDEKACHYTLEWLMELSELGNPIQIMSKYKLSDYVIDSLSKANKYFGHILYSTSITSVASSGKLEPFADSPAMRLSSLKQLKMNGLAVNVMIKPYLSGVTDCESHDIAIALKEALVDCCVVGDLLVDSRVSRVFKANRLPGVLCSSGGRQSLDCSGGNKYEVADKSGFVNFERELGRYGVKVFRKSSCVSAYILSRNNPANYFNHDPDGYCVKCGACQ